MSFLRLAKAKKKTKPQYVEKKKTPSGEVRIYDESHIKKRWKQKVDKIKKLETGIAKLRKKYRDDLKDDNDAKTRATAAIVGLIDNTAMRVGNEASVGEHGSFGATTLLKEHATVSGNHIRFKFKGKKGVAQDVVLDDAAVASEIKKLLAGKKGKDLIFEYEEGKQIRPKVVNRYLEDFGITAKDIRGFQANQLMKKRLKKTKDFDAALEFVADKVGHEASTLMNQYLDPALVKKYKKAYLVSVAMEDLTEAERVIDEIFGAQAAPVAPSEPASTGIPVAAPVQLSTRNRNTTVGPHITSPFGQRVDPITGKQKNHHGVDLRAKEGSPIVAFGGGKVVATSSGGTSGNFVAIDHGRELISSYSHLSEIKVSEGQEVARGQVIGLAGSTGRVARDAAHLHFALKYKGKWVDPTSFLNTRNPTSFSSARSVAGRP